MRIEQNYSLEKHNTFHLPVKTRWFMEYETEEELQRILHDEYFQECLSLHIGGGSNLLFINDYNGIIIHSRIKGISISAETDEYVSLRVGAAEIWDDVVAYAVLKGWGGIENLSLIPGEAGAAAIQNIGAYGMEIKDVIESVEAYNQLTFEKRTFTNTDCEYGYRNSYFKNEHHDPHIITYITLRLSKNPSFSVNYGNLKEELTKYPEVTLETIREAVITIRRQKLPDPEVLGNAGSFFMNPIITAEHFEKLKKQFPDNKERLKHIFEKQVYGLAPTEIIYKIATSYILGFDEDTKDIKHNFRQLDALPYAKDGTLEQMLDELYSEQE